MRSWAAVAVALGAVVFAGAVACSGGSSDRRDEGGARGAFDRAVTRLLNHDWKGLYEQEVPSYRDRCSYDEFVKILSDIDAATSQAGYDMSKFEYNAVQVTLDGDVARVTYTVTYNGRVIQQTTDADADAYRYVDGHWYSDAKYADSCALTLAPTRASGAA